MVFLLVVHLTTLLKARGQPLRCVNLNLLCTL